MSAHRKTRRIAVSGPTGSGKTTFAREMSRHPGVCAVLEPRPSQLLGELDTGDSADCYDLQRAIILGRLEAEQSCGSAETIVRDRTLDEDFAIFATMHFANGLISTKQLDTLRALALEASSIVGPPDAYVLLNSDQPVLRERILTAKAPDYIVRTLSDQLRLYDKWSASLNAPYVRLDTSRINPHGLSAHSAWILQTVSEALAGAALRNPSLGIAWEG